VSIGALGRGLPFRSPTGSVALAGGAGAAAFAQAGGSIAAAFARDSFQPAAASASPAPAGAAGSGGGMQQVLGTLEKVVQALTQVVSLLKQVLGGGKQTGAPGGAPGGAQGQGAGAGSAPAGQSGKSGKAAGSGTGAEAPAGKNGDPTRGPTGESPIDIARSVLGKNASELKVKGRLSEEMEDWVPNNVNCANFVSAVLEEAGQITHKQHSASVANLRSNLERDPHFQKTSLQNAKPGDVVIMDTGRGANSHVVLFAGFKNGKPTFIGSNNANPDGSQRVTEGPMGYRITGVYTYAG